MSETPKTFNAEFQIHHILPTEVFNADFNKSLIKALGGERQLQSANNRIALFTTEESAKQFKNLQSLVPELKNIEVGAVWHNGGHNAYNEVVKQKLNTIFNGEVQLSFEQQRIAVIDLQANLKQMLIHEDVSLYGDEVRLKEYLDKNTISADELINKNGRYASAEKEVTDYESINNDPKKSQLLNDRINYTMAVDEFGQITQNSQIIENGENTKFRELFKQEFADTLLKMKDGGTYSLTQRMLSDLKSGNISQHTFDSTIKALLFDNKLISDPPSPSYEANKMFPTEGTSGAKAFTGDQQTHSHYERYVSADGTLTMDESHYRDFEAFVDKLRNVSVDGTTAGKVVEYLNDRAIGGKVGGLLIGATFINDTFDGLIQGIDTGDWSKFSAQAKQSGTELVVGTAIVVAGVEAIPYIAGLLGIPVLGQIALAGLTAYGAYQGGKVIGELAFKLYDYFQQHPSIPMTQEIANWFNQQTNNLFGHGLSFDLPTFSQLFIAAEEVTSPLILDLNHDGHVGTTSLIDDSIYFNLDNQGNKEKTAWVDTEDGLLVLDKNADGKINTGNELFGNYTQLQSGEIADNGFDALADYDLNYDGQIDEQDDIYSKLQVWQDINHNGKVDQGELRSLSEIGITSIRSNFDVSMSIDEFGNAHKETSSFTWANGETGTIDDVWFKTDTLHPLDESTDIKVSDQIKALPDLQHIGNMPSLHYAMATDSTGHLTQLVEELVHTGSMSKKYSLLDNLLYEWAGVSSVITQNKAPGSSFEDRLILTLEKFMGRSWRDSTGPNQIEAVMDLWKMLKTQVLLQFDLQQKLPELITHIQYEVIDQKLQLNIPLLDNYIQSLSVADVALLRLTLDTSSKPLQDIFNSLKEHAALKENKTIQDQIFLKDIFLHLYNQDQQILLDPNEAQDKTVWLIDHNMVPENTPTSTQFHIYFFDQGDSIPEDQNACIVIDQLPEDIQVISTGDDSFSIVSKTTHQSITVPKGLAPSSHFQGIYFKDHQEWKTAELRRLSLLPTEGDDMIYGLSDTDNTINGGKGNDSLFGGNLGNTLYGGDGDDMLSGGAGNDVIEGGQGNDTITAGAGINTYIFNKGDGQDNIILSPTSDQATQTHLVLGYLPEDVHFEYLSYQINITFNHSTDSISLITSPDQLVKIQSITFANHEVWSASQIQTALTTKEQSTPSSIEDAKPSPSTPSISNPDPDEDDVDEDMPIFGTKGNDTLHTDAHHHTLIGGKGNDRLIGGTGSDTYVFSKGDGQDIVSDVDQNIGESNTDHIVFSDVTSSAVKFKKDGQDLVLFGYSKKDTVRVDQFFSDPAHQIESFVFSDQKEINNTFFNQYQNAANQMIDAMAGFHSIPEELNTSEEKSLTSHSLVTPTH